MRWLRRQWRERLHPKNWAWKWAKRPGDKKQSRRFRTLKEFAAHRARAAHHRAREAAERKDWKVYRRHKRTERMWLRTRAVYRRQQKRARKRWKRSQDHGPQGTPKYEVWMLSGASSNIDDDLKPVVAYLVVVQDQYITDTYDYSGHTSTSLHYPRNDPTPPQQGRAVDAGGPDMCGAQTAVAAKFDNNFLELFGPCPWYLKNGSRIPIQPYFPGHGDHLHCGVA